MGSPSIENGGIPIDLGERWLGERGWTPPAQGLPTHPCGQLISVPLWGWLADHWGRRPVLILGLLGIIVFVACFGLSPSYEWALVARFLWGLGCGNTGVMKVCLAEGVLSETEPGFDSEGVDPILNSQVLRKAFLLHSL